MIRKLEARDDVKPPPPLQNCWEKPALFLQVSLNLIRTFNCYKIDFLVYALRPHLQGVYGKK